MKDNILFVMKEVAICIGLVAISLGLNVFLFKDYVSEDITIETAKTGAYTSVERDKYIVINADILDAQNPTQKYETASGELDAYASELRFIQGTVNPFISEDGGSDLPSEMIGSSVEAAQ